MTGVQTCALPICIEATELEVFGASYRSFRADHLRLFSRASLARALGAAGFAAPAVESGCNLWLLRGLLADGELERLHADGRGPDLFALSQRSPP